jgi:hypothetical protein
MLAQFKHNLGRRNRRDDFGKATLKIKTTSAAGAKKS